MRQRINKWLTKPTSHKLKSILHHLNIVNLFSKLAVRILKASHSIIMSNKLGREILYTAYPENKLVAWSSKNEHYLLNSSDKVIGLSVFRDNEAFDVKKIYIALNYLPKTHSRKIIFDVGANIGTIGIHSIHNDLFESCVAFEPEPGNFRLLKANISLNDLDNCITAHNVALSDSSEGSLQFELSKNNHGDHRVRVNEALGKFDESERNTINVRCARLDDYAQKLTQETSLVWMDTQGFEGHVLAGGSKVVASAIPLVMEFWPYGLRRSDSFELLLDILEKSPYKMVTDLDNPDFHKELSRDILMEIANRLEYQEGHTDLLFL
ncbi:FkbM family methyltransferase [Lentilitoribacter sp. Alg239-R112]|uniref:FkbM family methyltransferase n=1 Tax=Lentilitoribacter sp. Alg239-R112 TaxID=2305987 RepID=UPI0013A69485|nr:FkbM family methyltransferase [Lentilitoribacter sp. Alg239-R112]